MRRYFVLDLRAFFAIALLFVCVPVYAQELDAAGRAKWYHDQMLNTETAKRLGYDLQQGPFSCCGKGDTFKTRFRVVEDGSKYGAQTYEYLNDDGRWKLIPPDIIQYKPTLDGQPVLFRRSDKVEICFIIGRENGG